MTSMPASRRARAMTFAPRSWPSRPGLATRTLIFLSLIFRKSILTSDARQQTATFQEGTHLRPRIEKIPVRLHCLDDVGKLVVVVECHPLFADLISVEVLRFKVRGFEKVRGVLGIRLLF